MALAIAKKRRDDLKKKSDEAKKLLEQLGPQYNAAQYHLDILMSRTPGLKEHAKAKEQEEDKADDVLEAALYSCHSCPLTYAAYVAVF